MVTLTARCRKSETERITNREALKHVSEKIQIMSWQSVKTQKPDAEKHSTIKSKSLSRETKRAVQNPSLHRMTSKRTIKTCKNSLERMPPEIILRILSYLDSGSLFCISFVNKLFHELSNSNSMWYPFYMREHTKKKKANQEDHMIRDLGLLGVQERPKGYWRNTFFKEIAGLNVNKWKKKLQRIDPYSGLPRHTEEILSPCTATGVSALFDDVDPEYGLHGYTAYIELHNTAKVIMSDRFSQLFCKRDQISDGYLPLELISENNRSLNTHLVGGISLPWRTEALHGTIKDCCMISLTVWDEAKQPFWCVSAPVVMTKENQGTVSYDCNGESFSILYQDSEGRVEMRLKQMEYKEQYFVVNLVIYISVAKVNKHFGRDY